MKIAICQINPVIGDFEYNSSLIKDATNRAKSSGCALAIFPEMCLCGYPPQDLLERPDFAKENLIQLQNLASGIKDISVLCGYVDINPVKTGKSLINGIALLMDGHVARKGGKRLFPAHDVYYDTRYFEPSPESLVFELGGKKWGVTVCDDIWSGSSFSRVPQHDMDQVSELAAVNIEILINISASPYTINKGATRLSILKELAGKYHFPVIYCNQAGGNDELLFDGSSMVVDQAGRLICLGKQFGSDFFIWDTEKEYDEITDPWPPEEESILNALIMGTRDYARKCGFKKVLLGLSGGIDSSLVAFIAREAMGAENVMAVSMPSAYTSEMSKEDARKLAVNLGIRLEEISIHELFHAFKDVLSPLFRGLKEGETEENIQARIRGNLLMALSNKFNALLLAPGNKSELAMGYCTLYGDMSGGLAVIADVLKTLCYRLVKHINREIEIIPQRIILRPPSAELKPNQTDQDTLPPYEVLDDILDAVIEKNLGFDEIVARGHDPVVVGDVLRRLATSEYKRRQAPPGLRITNRALGYGRRYPVARGRQTF